MCSNLAHSRGSKPARGTDHAIWHWFSCGRRLRRLKSLHPVLVSLLCFLEPLKHLLKLVHIKVKPLRLRNPLSAELCMKRLFQFVRV